jgi:hypothetical protein
MTEGGISKAEAAQRQLEDALRSYSNGEDILTINTGAYAAFKVLFDICEKQHGAKKANKKHEHLRKQRASSGVDHRALCIDGNAA